MSQFQTRLARPSDHTSLVRLCRRAVGPDDYVLHYLRDVIRGRGLFLAFRSDELVGMTNFDKCIDGSGWLGMARTDPTSRRQGVAIFLQNVIAKHARKNRTKILRMWTLSTNRRAIHACIKGGYRPVCYAVHVSQPLRRRKFLPKFAPSTTISTESANEVLKSRYRSKMNGYLSYKWHIIKPDLNVLRRTVKSREFYNVGETAFLLSIPDFGGRNTKRETLHSEFTLLAGPAEDSFRIVKEAAQSIRIGYLGGYLPLDRRLLEMAQAAGFRKDSWADHCVVFEKELR